MAKSIDVKSYAYTSLIELGKLVKAVKELREESAGRTDVRGLDFLLEHWLPDLEMMAASVEQFRSHMGSVECHGL